MSNTFNISRFLKYFTYDLRSRWQEQRTFMLTYTLIPVIFYLIYIFFTTLGNGVASAFSGITIVHPGIAIRGSVFAITVVIFMLLYPSRAYGFITEKAKGSAWIALPASRLEKFLSMMLICLIIIPVVFFCGYFLCDGAICLFDKECGDSLFSAWVDNHSVGFDQGQDEVALGGYGFWWLVSAVLQVSSVFLLGALIFKKMKVTKTVLALFIIFMVIFAIGATILDNIDLGALGDKIQAWMYNNIDHLDFWFNFWANIELAIVVIGCGIWSWFRVKKLQH